MSHDVFVSHSAKNKAAADAAVAALERAGVRCWVAPRDILAGEEWAEAILRGINGARAMVLIFSKDSNLSEHVHREVERAANRGLPILPLRIEEVMPSGAMEYFLSSRHWLDAMNPPLEAHLKELCDTVAPLVGHRGPVEAGATPVTAPARQIPDRKSSRSMKGVAVVALILVCGLAVLFGLEWGRRWAHKSDERATAQLPSSTASTMPTVAALSPTETRQARIAALMAEARQNDTHAQGHRALVALDNLLALDPDDPDAIALRRKIVGYYAHELASLLKQAADIAKNDSSVDNRLGYLEEIVIMQAYIGDLAGARANVPATTQPAEQLPVYLGMVAGQSRAGDIAGAQATRAQVNAKANVDTYSRASVSIALRQIQDGDFESASQTAQSDIPDTAMQSQIFGLIAQSQARQGDVSGAERTIQKIVNPAAMPEQKDESGWAFIALGQMQAGDFNSAIRTAEKVKGSRLASELSATLSYERALYLARTNQISAARDAADALAPIDSRIDVLCAIAPIQLAYGDPDGARQTWLRAQALLPASDTKGRACLLADAGDQAAATLAMSEISDYVSRAAVCREIACTQAKSGDWPAARQWAETRESPMDKLLSIIGAVEGVVGRAEN
jgi:hypothetical protein